MSGAKIEFARKPVYDDEGFGIVIGWKQIKTTTEVVEFIPRPEAELKAAYAMAAIWTDCSELAAELICKGGLSKGDLEAAREKVPHRNQH